MLIIIQDNHNNIFFVEYKITESKYLRVRALCIFFILSALQASTTYFLWHVFSLVATGVEANTPNKKQLKNTASNNALSSICL